MSDARDGVDFSLLSSLSARLVVVLPVPLWSLKKFADDEIPLDHPLRDHLFCDPGGKTFKALGAFNLKFDTRTPKPGPHQHTSVLSATWKGFTLGVTSGMQGDPRQQGGSYVLHRDSQTDPDTRNVSTVWTHIDRFNADQVPLPILVKAAGLPDNVYKHPTLKK